MGDACSQRVRIFGPYDGLSVSSTPHSMTTKGYRRIYKPTEQLELLKRSTQLISKNRKLCLCSQKTDAIFGFCITFYLYTDTKAGEFTHNCSYRREWPKMRWYNRSRKWDIESRYLANAMEPGSKLFFTKYLYPSAIAGRKEGVNQLEVLTEQTLSVLWTAP